MTLSADKAALRVRMRALLAAITPEDGAAWSLALCTNLARTLPRTTRTVMAFAPTPQEPDLRPWARATPARLCLPQINWQARTMAPALVANLDDGLVIHRHGIAEPPHTAPQVPLPQIDAILVPALAFDPAGRRLGRGGGFYDRLLAQAAPHTLLVGICFDLQVVDRVPSEAHDQTVGIIVTERRVIRPGG